MRQSRQVDSAMAGVISCKVSSPVDTSSVATYCGLVLTDDCGDTEGSDDTEQTASCRQIKKFQSCAVLETRDDDWDSEIMHPCWCLKS